MRKKDMARRKNKKENRKRKDTGKEDTKKTKWNAEKNKHTKSEEGRCECNEQKWNKYRKLKKVKNKSNEKTDRNTQVKERKAETVNVDSWKEDEVSTNPTVCKHI